MIFKRASGISSHELSAHIQVPACGSSQGGFQRTGTAETLPTAAAKVRCSGLRRAESSLSIPEAGRRATAARLSPPTALVCRHFLRRPFQQRAVSVCTAVGQPNAVDPDFSQIHAHTHAHVCFWVILKQVDVQALSTRKPGADLPASLIDGRGSADASAAERVWGPEACRRGMVRFSQSI